MVFLLALVFICYVNAINNSFVSDDRGLILNMPNWDANAIFSNPYPFLRQFLYVVVYKIGGLNPALFRLLNIFFHAGVVLAIYTILSAMQKPKIGFLAAALTAVHPILIESITWITAGVHAQYSFFFLLAFLFYILPRKNIRNYLVSLGFYILALLSSEKAVVLALAFPLFEYSFGKLSKSWKRIVPYFILSGIWSLLYLQLLRLRSEFFTGQHAIESANDNPFLHVTIAITSYLQLIFWPDGLTIYHSELSFTVFEYVIRAIVLIIFLGFILYSFKYNRFIFFWLSFFIVTLLPTLNPYVNAWVVAERYVYLGTAGILVVISVAIMKISQNLKLKMATYMIFSFIIFSLIVRTIVRNVDWKDEDHLWVATARTSPSSAQNHNNLGDYYGRQGDTKNSIAQFKTAIVLNPKYADAYHNLGNAYRDSGNDEAAIASYEKALSIDSRIWQSYQNIALIYYKQEEFAKAKEYIEKGVMVDPQNPNQRLLQGLIYIKTNEKEKAKELLMQILKLDPNNQLAKQGLQELGEKVQ